MKASVLEFRLEGEIFCFNTKDIAYVFELEEYTPLQGVNEAVLGVAQYNQDVMPLVDTLYLYAQKKSAMEGEKSVVVIHDDAKNIYGLLVDEILKIVELDAVEPTVDMSTDELVINHYKEDDSIVNEIHPLPLLKKFQVMSMRQELTEKKNLQEQKEHTKDYLLFSIESTVYAIASEYVKEVIENNTAIFELEQHEKLIGAVAVRDEVISVAKLQAAKNSDSMIIAQKNGKKIAFFVDEIFDIESFEERKIEIIDQPLDAVDSFYNFQNKVVGLINPHYYLEDIHTENEEASSKTEDTLYRYEYLTFRLAGRRFAIDMGVVRQVVESEMLSKTDSSSIASKAHIRYIATWNHHAICVADISSFLGVTLCEETNTQTIFIEHEEMHIAFLVDEVEDIIYLKKEDIKENSNTGSIVAGAVVVENEVLVAVNENFLIRMCD